MKQTNSAIKFLVAQYRAIFKSAFSKGLSTAFVLTAALAASSANAAVDTALDVDTEWTNALKGDNGVIEITGKDTDKGANGKFQNIVLTGTKGNTSLTLDEGKKLIISDATSASSSNKLSSAANNSKLIITGRGDIDISAVNTDNTKHGLEVSASGKGDVIVDVRNVNVQSDLSLKTSGTDNDSTISFAADNITVGNGIFEAGKTDDKKVHGVATVTVGDSTASGSVAFGRQNSTITVNKDGKISVAGTSGATAEVGSTVLAEKLNVNGGIISFEAAAASGKSIFNVADTKFNGGIFSVKDGANLNLDVSNMNFANGATVALGDTLHLKEGTITISDDTVLASTGNKGKLTLAPSSNSSKDDTAVLKISSQTLKSYLTGLKSDGTTKLQYTDESVLFNDVNSSKALKDASKGSVLMYSGATIELTDAAADIANDKIFKFGTASAADGAIVVSGGTIRGKNLTVSKELANASKLEVAAEHLTLGSKEFDGSKAFAVGNFYANNVTLVPNKGKSEFVLKDKLELENFGHGSIAGSLNVDGGQVQVIGGDFSFGSGNNLTITSGSGSTGLVIDEASLSLSGKLTTTATNGKISITDGIFDTSNVTEYKVASNTIEMEEASNLILNGSKILDLSDKTKVTFDANKFAADAVSGGDLSTITMANINSMTMEQFKSMQTQTSFKGLFDGFRISDANASGSMTLDQVQHGTPDNVYNGTQVKVSTAIDKSYSFGSVLLSGTNTLEITPQAGSGALVKLINAGANNNSTNRFIQTSDGKIGGVKLSGSSSALVLEGNGSIGAVTVADSGDGALIVGSIDGKVKGNVVVKGNIANNNALGIGTLQVSNGSSLQVKGVTVRANELFVHPGSSFIADKAVVSINGDSTHTSSSEIMGSEFKAKELRYLGSGSHIIGNNALVEVGTLTGSSNAKIRIGSDEKNGLGATVIAGTMDLNGSTLVVDPAYGNAASYHIVDNLAQANKVDGKLVVGKNAVTAIGFKDKASVQAIVDNYLDANGSFKADSSVKNALVLNKHIEVNSGAGITIDPNTTDIGSAGLTFGKGSALVLTKASVTGTSAIKFTNKNTTVDASQGGDIVLVGDFTAGDTFTVFEGTTKIDGKLKVHSANEFLNGEIGIDGKVTNLKLDKDKLYSQMAGISAPVRDLFIKVMGKDGDKYFSGADVGAEFIKNLKTTSMTGVEADAAAHAATYAGAQQAAVAAVGTMAEAVAGRAGSTGVETTVLAATGSEGHGGVWVTPMYKSVKSDGFDAQGGSHGADVDLAGVTFGADTVRGNMRFGAAFNIGSGDADGKGNGNGLKDEFDYYGFGMYSAMSFGDITVLGDASVNVISHDVKGGSGVPAIGELSASADTTAVTLGVTGQYTIVTPMLDVVPHAGMRFTRLDTDSYELKSAKGVVANTDYDVQNVFSIPLGVTLSKVFENNGWVFAPQADLSLTFNTGDIEVDSNTKFSGVTENLALNTEVMDKVTYSMNFGVAAQYGNFGTSLNVGYTGSSNTDSVGVNANARYMF